MRFIFVTEPDQPEHIEETVRKAVPSAKFEKLEQYMMWPELSIDFYWRDLDTVVATVKQALERPDVRV